MPIYRGAAQGRAIMAAALLASDLIGFDRNWFSDSAAYLPRGRMLSPAESLRLAPGISTEGLTGGALWYDAQMHSSERLTLAVVRSAVNAGAEVANYVAATELILRGERVIGIEAEDGLTGERFPIRANIVVNAAGPWADDVLAALQGRRRTPKVCLSTAMNLVTRQIIPNVAVGVPSITTIGSMRDTTSRLLFIAPWNGYSLIGTTHTLYSGHPDDDRVTEPMIQAFLDQVNRAYPGAVLTRQDVYTVHRGFLPADAGVVGSHIRLIRRGQVLDHAQVDRVAGLITAIGVKYTTARRLAEQAVDMVCQKLGKQAPSCSTRTTPLYGGHIDSLHDFVAREVQRPRGLAPDVVRQLIHSYGSEYQRILRYLAEAPGLDEPVCGSSAVIGAEVLHAIREEMAQRLGDVVFRRTALGAAGHPGEEGLSACAAIMAQELGWSAARRERELAEVRASFGPLVGAWEVIEESRLVTKERVVGV
jgi:glycerol-3-phosphate dehydrogenase